MKSLLGPRLAPSLGLFLTTIWLCGLPHSTVCAQTPPHAVDTLIVGTTRAPLDLGTIATTLPPDSITHVTTIAITGGSRPDGGSNLFHSFDFFSVGTNDIAHFQNDMMLPTTNIIARVIGDAAGLRQASTIDGILRTNNPLNALDPLNFGAANLYLVNPAGIIFGPHAQLDIKGSFAATTADYLRMTDGAQFHTDPVQQSVLSIGDVAAFGFTNPQPVTITVQGPATLQVPTDQTLTLIGGDIMIVGSTLRAASGQINIASVASAGEVIPNQPGQSPSLDVSSFTSLGQITESSLLNPLTGALVATSNLTVSSSLGAGTLVVRGGSMTLDNSFTSAQNTGTINANPIGQDIAVTGDLILRNTSSMLAQTINAQGAGMRIAAGRLVLESNDVVTSKFSGFNSSSFGSGRAGDIAISARTIESRGNTNIGSNTFASGRGGDVQIIAEGMVMDSQIQGTYLPAGSTVSSSVALTGGIGQPGAGTGQGGIVRLNVGDLQLLNGAQVITATRGAGTGGAIDVQANSLLVSGVNLANGSPSSLVSSAAGPGASGTAGNIHVVADSIVVQNNGQIRADLLDGSPGNAGNIAITTRTVDVGNRGIIAAAAVNGTGNAGNIDITANDVHIIGVAGTADPFGFDATGIATSTNAGHGGTLTLNADTLVVAGNGVITSRTIGAGNAGTVDLQIASSLSLATGGIVSASTSGSGVGGSVAVTTPILSLDSGIIEAKTSSTGNAGSITLNTNVVSLFNAGQVTSSSVSTATGRAGNITVQGLNGAGSSAQSISLTGANTSITSDTDNTGRGGDIQIRAGQVQLTDLASLTATTSGTGRAGSIGVTSDNLSVTGGARIEASTSGVGHAGDITITNTDTVSITGLSRDGSTRSGIFAKTQSSGGITGSGSGGGSGGGGSGGGSGGGGGQTSTAGDAGNILITTNNLLLSGGAQIDSSTTTSGSGGSVSVNADDITITGTSTSLRSDASRGNGTGGDIELGARTIGIHDKASVTAATDGSGDAGNISMTANKSLTLDSAAIITTSTRGSGTGGTILINSPQVLVDGLGTSITASTLRPFADLAVTLNIVHPNDGDLTVRLDSPDGTRVALLSHVGGSGDNFTGTIFDDQATRAIPGTNSGAPFTDTFMPREPLAQLIDQNVAGTWKLNINDQVPGNAGVPQNLTGWSLRVGDHVFESSNVPRNIPDGGSVSSSLVVTVPAGTVVQGIGEATGSGGNVTIKADMVTVQNGATLSATTRGSGQGGTVSVDSRGGLVTLAGPGTGLFTNSEASGRSGDINVKASHMTMDNGAKVSAASSGTGDAGNVTITALDNTVSLASSSSITSSTTGAGNAGQVIVTTPTLNLDNATITTSTSSSGNAGGITAIVDTLSLTGGAQITSASTGTASGAAGSVTIQGLASPADAVTLTNSSLRTSADSTGRGGSITVDTTNLTLNGATISASVKDVNAGDDPTSGLGNIALSSSIMHMTGGTITAATTGTRNAGTITMTTTGDTLNVGGGGSITSSTTGAGNAGQVIVTTPTLDLDNATITTSTSSSGNAGGITAIVDTLSLTGGAQITSASTGTASGAAGSVTIQGLASPADAVTLTNSSLRTSADSTGRGGSITVDTTNLTLNGATISASVKDVNAGDDPTSGLGNIALSSSTMHMTGGTVTAETNGARNAGTITMTTTGDTLNVGGDGSITSSTTGAGNAGQVIVTTPTLNLDNATITTSTSSSGNAGGITAIVDTLSLTGGAQITSASTGTASGAAGSVTIQGLASPADAVTLTNSSLRTSADSTGRGGSITVDTTNLTLNGATISASVKDVNAGDDPTSGLGNIALSSSTMHMTGGTVTAETSGARNAGTITMTTTGDTLNVGGGGSITSSTTGAGNAGQVIVITPTLDLDNATITTSTSSTGDAGSITVNAGSVVVQNSGQLSSSSAGAGAGGTLLLQGLAGVGSQAAAFTITGSGSGFFSTTSGSGAGGSITAYANQMTISDGGTVSAASTSTGNAGSIAMTTSGPILLDSGLISTSAQTAQGGDITITSSNSITLQDHALVSASSHGAGNAGSITIDAGQQYLSTNSAVTTQATKASGGDITVTALEMIRLINSQINTSVAGGNTTLGGNILIDPQFVILQNSQILAQAFAGTGGNITITAASAYIADPLSIVDASSTLGISGTVNILSPVQNVGGQLTPLSQQFSSAAALLAQQCAARAVDGKFSTFLVAAREGLPVEPGGFLASPSWTSELFGSSLSGRDPHIQLSAVTGLFPKHDARPIQLAKFGGACPRQ